MEKISKRDEIQKLVSFNIIKNKFNTLIDIAPRVGKSKICIESFNSLINKSILVTAPYNSILESWKNEITKWSNNNSYYTFINQRSLDNTDLNLYDYIICDEVHTLSLNQKYLLQPFKDKILGITGSLAEDTKWELYNELNLKLSFTYSIEEAIEDGIISDYMIYLHPIQLDSKNKYYKVKIKKQEIVMTELDAYNFYTKEFEKYKNLSYQSPFYSNVKMNYAGKRADFIYNSNSKIAAVNNYLNTINEKCLIFTARTKIADLLCEDSFHSKSNPDSLNNFIENKIDKLSVVDCVSMGITFPNLKLAILQQLKSSEELAIQKILRTMNLEDEKTASIHIFYYKNTVDEQWCLKALNKFNKEKIIKV